MDEGGDGTWERGERRWLAPDPGCWGREGWSGDTVQQGQVAPGGAPLADPPTPPRSTRRGARTCRHSPNPPPAPPYLPGLRSPPTLAAGGAGAPRSSVPAGEGQWRLGTPGCSVAECGSGWEKPERSLEGGKMRKGPRDARGPGVLPLSPLHLVLARLPRARRYSQTPRLPIPSRPRLFPAPHRHRDPEEAASELGGLRRREILNSRPKCFLSSRERDVPREPGAATRLGGLGV